MLAAPTEERTAARVPTLGHIPSLDGIRAVAVTAVVLYHGGVSGVHGGFLGVDVFFVLSGFLITSLLATELTRRDTLSFARFYERRARRLLPALVVLIGLVALIAYVVAPHGSYPSLPRQVLGTMAYVGNWTLISSHSTYFSLGLPPSPLQHTWSLAIEEQFYLVWPALLFVLWRITKSHRALALACVVSSLLCALVTAIAFSGSSNVNSLYFATETHATTMLLGAALAFLVLRAPRGADESPFVVAAAGATTAWNVAGAAAWAGVVAMFLTASGTGALLYRGGFVVVGAVVALAIGATVLVPGGWSARVLGLAPFVAIGQISYGIYLFHFPLFIWIDHGWTGLSGLALLAVRVAATLAMATASYVLVERPIRERRLIKGRSGLIGSVAAFLAVAVLAFSVTTAAASVPFADRAAQRSIVRHPPLGTTTTVLIVGDSMAQTLANGLNDSLARRTHLYVAVIPDRGCSLVATKVRIKDFRVTLPRRCLWTGPLGFTARWSKKLRRLHPQLSMLLFRLDINDHLLFGRWTHIGSAQFDCVLRQRIVDAAATLAATGRPVVLLTTPYYSTGEQPNGSTWPEDAPSRVRAYNRLLRDVAAQYPGVIHVVDLSRIVSPEGRYTRTIGSTVIRWVDGVHFTYGGDAYILPRLLPSIASIARATPSAVSLARLSASARANSPGSCRRA